MRRIWPGSRPVRIEARFGLRMMPTFPRPHAGGLQSLMAAASAAPQETVFIGDRADRDGGAGQRAGVRILIRSPKPIETPSRRFTIRG
jgi:hypothetical protein